ncbi:hypothetical protein Peur_049321 [Populus x canadensis]
MATGTEAKEGGSGENKEPPLKYKTLVLKVSVHCEECKRKVKRILNNIDGVYTTDIDLRQQKATVMGNVDADTLIKKLIKKTGKHAELWPEKADNNQKDKKKGKGKKKEKEKGKGKESDQESSDEEGSDGGNEKEVKGKTEVCQTVTSPGGGQSPVTDKKVDGQSEVGAGGSAGGGKKKKKKKKKKKAHTAGSTNTVDEAEHSVRAPAGTGSPTLGNVHVQIAHPTNHSPQRQHVYDYPATTYYAPTVYAVSSNVACPSTFYGASYYSPPYSYACMHPPSDLDSYPPQPSGSFEIFSDENPNACSIM